MGETDQPSALNTYYDCAFRAMITAWRRTFTRPDLPFDFVLLAPWSTDNRNLPPTRLAQLNATTLPGVGYAAAYDLGDPGAPLPGHPRFKQAIGARFAAALLHDLYGGSGVAYQGPRFVSASAAPRAGGALNVTVTFAADTLGGCESGHPLVLNHTVESTCPADIPAASCATFAARTSDGVWREATASTLTADETALVFTVDGAPAGATVVATRGMHATWPLATLTNGCGFPVQPWREGAWQP